jgi:hypothetical protein
MDADCFDDVLREWGSSRRPILGAGLGALLGLAGISPGDAKKKKKKKKCKAPRVKCGKVCCAAGETCQDGTCTSTSACPKGQTRCNGLCVDTLNDAAHCGGCGNLCDPGYICQNGLCPRICTPDQTRCSTYCADTDNDPANCGACGEPCAPGFACQGGECHRATGTCTAGQDSCAAGSPISCSISGDITDCACVKDLAGTTLCARVAFDSQLCGCQTDAECQSREFPGELGGGTYPNAVCVKSGSSGACNLLCQTNNICAIPCQQFHDGD